MAKFVNPKTYFSNFPVRLSLNILWPKGLLQVFLFCLNTTPLSPPASQNISSITPSDRHEEY